MAAAASRLCLTLAVIGAVAAGSAETTWARWAAEFKPSGYGTPEAEVAAREIWHRNDRYITEHNAMNLSYTLGHNQFSDLTAEQFATRLSRSALNISKPSLTSVSSVLQLPTSVDWQKAGRVTPVLNEGQCGEVPPAQCFPMLRVSAVCGD